MFNKKLISEIVNHLEHYKWQWVGTRNSFEEQHPGFASAQSKINDIQANINDLLFTESGAKREDQITTSGDLYRALNDMGKTIGEMQATAKRVRDLLHPDVPNSM